MADMKPEGFDTVRKASGNAWLDLVVLRDPPSLLASLKSRASQTIFIPIHPMAPRQYALMRLAGGPIPYPPKWVNIRLPRGLIWHRWAFRAITGRPQRRWVETVEIRYERNIRIDRVELPDEITEEMAAEISKLRI